jgi:hypothetical protein
MAGLERRALLTRPAAAGRHPWKVGIAPPGDVLLMESGADAANLIDESLSLHLLLVEVAICGISF